VQHIHKGWLLLMASNMAMRASRLNLSLARLSSTSTVTSSGASSTLLMVARKPGRLTIAGPVGAGPRTL